MSRQSRWINRRTIIAALLGFFLPLALMRGVFWQNRYNDLDESERRRDGAPGCTITFRFYPFDRMLIQIAITGNRRELAQVDVYPPHADVPLPVSGRHMETFGNIDERYISQNYDEPPDLLAGTYRIEAHLDGRITTSKVHLPVGDHIIYAACN